MNPVDWFDVVHQNQVGHQGNCGTGQESLFFWWSHPGNCLAGNIKTWKKQLASIETPKGADCQGLWQLPVWRICFIFCLPISQVYCLLILLPFPVWKTSTLKRQGSKELESPFWVYTADLLRLDSGSLDHYVASQM